METKVLTIAGFDGSAGAGMQADLKTFSALECYGTTVLTVLPVQNTVGVRSIYELEVCCVEEQLRAILEDIEVKSVKIGMLYSKEIIERVARVLEEYRMDNIVLDPVMVAKSGDLLLQKEAVYSMVENLFPLTTVLTPNLLEASEILGWKIRTKSQMERAARELLEMGPKGVVVKGGHLDGEAEDCLVLKHLDLEMYWFTTLRIQTRNTHGTGCTFSAAIAAFLAKGYSIMDAVKQAKHYITEAIRAGAQCTVGQGNGPVHHFHHLWMECS